MTTTAEMTDAVEAKLQIRQKAENTIRNRFEVMQSHNGHPHLPYYIELFETFEKWYIVTTYLPGGDLLSYVRRHDGGEYVPEYLAKHISAILLTTLSYLHHYGIAHRDLKPTNVMLADPNNIDSLLIVDFGSSFVTLPKEEMRRELLASSSPKTREWDGPSSMSSSPDSDTITFLEVPYGADLSFHSMPHGNLDMVTLAGTPFYLAPEVIDGSRYTTQVSARDDAVSAGAKCAFLCSQQPRRYLGPRLSRLSNSLRLHPLPTCPIFPRSL
jgi:serine/threonine protein kinase